MEETGKEDPTYTKIFKTGSTSLIGREIQTKYILR